MAFDFRVRTAQEFIDRFGAETDDYRAILYPSREAWLEGRKGFIGASDAYKILDTELRKALFEEMTGKREHENLDDNEFVARGVAAEPYVRALIPIENPDLEVFDGGNLQFLSKKYPWASATLDCIGFNRVTGELVDIELKEAPWSNKWKGDYAPDGYVTQLFHQSAVTGIQHFILHPRIYLMHGGGLTTAFERSYEYYADDEAVAPQIQELMETERVFHAELQTGKYKPVLSLPSIF